MPVDARADFLLARAVGDGGAAVTRQQARGVAHLPAVTAGKVVGRVVPYRAHASAILAFAVGYRHAAVEQAATRVVSYLA